MAKSKRTTNLQNITQKTKDRATRTPPETESELRCHGMVGSSWITTRYCSYNPGDLLHRDLTLLVRYPCF
jgi:hypothetical protein